MNKKQFIVLMGKRREVLPAGFTELEYLESSGTQFIDLLVQPNNETGIECVHETTLARDILLAGTRNGDSRWLAAISRGGYATDGFGWNAWHAFGKDYSLAKARGAVNINNNRKARLEYADGRVIEEDITETLPPHSINAYLFAYNFDGVANYKYIGKVFHVVITQGNNEVIRDLIPALRNADGVAGMWDRVSKQFFVNAGTGSFGYRIKRTGETVAAMSLRDPWRVAPSGVYARRAVENEIEIVADTEETSGDGWEWFANTAEAYEHFNIVPVGANEPLA